MSLLRYLQTVTAAVAVFTLLGACGLAPARSYPRQIVRPHPPAGELTIRSLTGTWVAVWQTPDAVEAVTLAVVQSGDALAGSLMVDGRTLASDAARPARVGVDGRFTIELGQQHEIVVVEGRPDAAGDRISASIIGLSARPTVVTFRRQ